MTISDHDKVLTFWKTIDGLSIDASDELPIFERYLLRNPKLSYLAEIDNVIIGTIKCAHDGRRGYIHHMAVSPKYRSLGIAKCLFSYSLKELKNQGIFKCNLYVLDTNPNALSFWKHNGWNPLERNFDTLQRDLNDL